MDIRPIRPEDADALTRFFSTLTPTQRENFHPHPFTAETAQRIASGSRIGGPVWVAMDAEHIVGYAFLSNGAEEWPGLGIAVAPASGRRGIGTTLVATAVAWARAAGARGVVLTVYQDNEPAIRTYRKIGFRTTRALWFMEVDFSPMSYHPVLGANKEHQGSSFAQDPEDVADDVPC